MGIRVRGLGSLGLASETGMKAALNALEIATGKTGRYNAGDASSSSLSGNAGFFTFKAVYHLIIDSANTTSEITSLASNLAGGISSEVGKAFDLLDDATKTVAGVIGDSLGLLDKAGGAPALIIWNIDQLTGKRYIEKFLGSVTDEVATLAGLYLSALKKGLGGGTQVPVPPTQIEPTVSFRDRFKSEALVLNQGPPKIDAASDTTPIRKTSAVPKIAIGAAAIAAAFLLVR